jgi:RNA polymerase sigma-70 factor (ECF subfamily)
MRLPAAQRMAVTLYYYEDRSVEQAAAILGMPENTVKTHLARARAALRVAVQKEGL